MKTALKILTATFAASIPGVAFAEIANVSRLVAVQGETLLALFVGAAMLLIMATDYSRGQRSLAPAATVVRPSLPSGRNADTTGRATLRHAA